MSSSESSEDEEEIKKINEAVIPSDLLSTLTSFLPKSKPNNNKINTETETEHRSRSIGRDGSTNNNNNDNVNEKTILHNLAIKFKKKERKVDTGLQKLKSNRPDKMMENDRSVYHATTPGFRAHIEKRLQQILDSEIQGSLSDSVWSKPEVNNEKKTKGIKLFSDVKSLCLGEADVKQHQEVNVARSPPKIIPTRKRKLHASSSESSDDEVKINSCVFSVDDIMHENKMLENLSKSGVAVDPSRKESKENGDSESFSVISDSKQSTTKTERKKKSKDKETVTMKAEDGCDMEMISVKKKKRKKSQENSDNRQETNVTAMETQSDEPMNKKKKKKKKKCKDDAS